MKELIIPSSVMSIGEKAFSEINAEIYIYYWGNYVFYTNIFSSSQRAIISVPKGGVATLGGKKTFVGDAKSQCQSNGRCFNKCKSTMKTTLTYYIVFLAF